jgi:hypothetical protein
LVGIFTFFSSAFACSVPGRISVWQRLDDHLAECLGNAVPLVFGGFIAVLFA